MKSGRARSLTHTVAGNTLWYGGELAVAVLCALLTSIPVARIIGPVRLSYFTYLQWLTNISGLLAMVGIPMTTRKYMAEYLAQNDRVTAWAIFRNSLRVQMWIVAGLLVAGAALTARLVKPGYHIIALLMLSTVAAKLVVCIPSNANNAAENLRANFFGALAGGVATVAIVNFGLWTGWDLIAVAGAAAIGMFLELAIKMVMMLSWLRPVREATLPPELRRRMTRFSGQGLVLMVLQIVVWDRSDLVFLNLLDKDPRQVTFFALAFNLVDKILMIPQAFGQVVGVSVMAEYGRDREKLHRFVSVAVKYGLIVSVPVMIGTAAVSSPLIQLMYRSKYLPVIPVLMIGALLAITKPLLAPLQSLLQAEDSQGFLIWWTILCGAANVALDLTLIPWAGARGAMLANGIAQSLAIAGIWIMVARTFSVRVPLKDAAAVLAAGLIMWLVVWRVNQLPASPAVHLVLAVPLGALAYLLALRILKVLDEADGSRLGQVVKRLPGVAGRVAVECVAGMVRGKGAQA